jgi:transposase
MEHFFFLVKEKGMSVRGAAKQLNIPSSTAANWEKKSVEAGDEFVELRKSGSGKPVGRPPTLTDAHQEYLLKLVDENETGLTLDQMMESLTTEFMGLKISKSAFHEFTRKKCRISCKRAHFQPVERGTPEKIEQRYNWAKNLEDTDIDFESNCVFIDEAGFHINMKRTFAWGRVGKRAIVKTPKTKSKTTTILGAVSALGVVNVKVRLPKVAQSKKRKLDGNKEDGKKQTVGTVTGHYFNFIATTLDIMDQHDMFKGYYLVMDNAPIHKNLDIKHYIESRGYGCVYLPSYSPELNPIEQFWSVCKSKLKREALLKEETLTSRIREACNSVLISDLKGFCRYSVRKLDECLQRKPI